MTEHCKGGWTVLIGGLLVNLMLGVTYSWSVFSGPLSEKYGWSQMEVQLAFSIMLAVNAFSMILGGILIDRRGPSVVALLGGVLLGLGFIATGIFASSPLVLYITYGAIVGIGVGIAYGAPIAAATRWFEKNRGLATGIVLFGFGASSLILAPVANWLIISFGVSSAFIALGILFALAVPLSSRLLKSPEVREKSRTAELPHQFSPQETLRSNQFWLLWAMLLFAVSAGLMVIGNLATFARLSLLTIHGIGENEALSLAALSVGILAIFNGCGRVLAGFLSDSMGRRETLAAVFLLQALLVSSLVPASRLSPLALFIWVASIGFCFGANFSLFPSIIADFFGTARMGVNYGLLFTAYGLGGILGPQLMAFTLDSAKSANGSLVVSDYFLPFFYVGALVATAAVLTLFARKPVWKERRTA